MKTLKIRASALGKIMHFDAATKITPKQLETIDKYQAKDSLTENQTQELKRLIEKRDAPPALSQGAKTYVKDLFFGHKFNYQKRFTNKYTQKGNKMEDPAIAEIVKLLGLPMVFKNETHLENDWTKGTPDVPVKPLNFQFDVKNVYYPNGLDSFDTKPDHDYLWQGHCYNWLLEVDHGMIIKILLNPPEDLLEREARTLWVEAGNEWSKPISDDFMDDVRELFDFEKLPTADRVKIFQFTTTEKEKAEMRQAVELAREYYAELEEAWKVKNTNEIKFINELFESVEA